MIIAGRIVDRIDLPSTGELRWLAIDTGERKVWLRPTDPTEWWDDVANFRHVFVVPDELAAVRLGLHQTPGT